MSSGKEQNSTYLKILTEAVHTVLSCKLRSKDSEFSQHEKNILCYVHWHGLRTRVLQN